jgi:RNA polymerase sigma-70 factor (ECF subfamily)
MTAPPKDVERLVADLFRRASGRLTAALTRRFGPQHLSLAEDAVQDALMRALQSWPFTGVPGEPERWLFRAAVNRGLDALRHETLARDKADLIAHDADLARRVPDGGVDDELAMMFMCCHPSVPHAARIALTLKTVGGLGVDEIAAAFLAEPPTIAQRLVRAKAVIRDGRLPFEVPGPDELPERLSSVLDVLYLLFNEGYNAHGGENLTRAELCNEAIRLARLLLANPRTALPHVHALLALMLFHAARLPARTDAAGDILLLGEQDRGRWDADMTAEAFRRFEASFAGPKTALHVEAAIASVHAAAGTGPTDWSRICFMYDELMALKPTPVKALNRAIAIGMAQGSEAGLRALESVSGEPQLANYHLLPSAQGAFWLKAGEIQKAAMCYRAALTKPCTPPERRFLERELARCADASPDPISA